MGQPLVSICIPAYGRPQELRMAIKSVLSQDFRDLEVVVADDSGDLENVVNEVDDGRVHYRKNPVRLGMAGNWTGVLDAARGQLIGLLMDDDWLLPTFVSSVLRPFAVDRRVGIVFTNHYFHRGNRLYERRCALEEGTYDDFLLPLLVHQPVAVSAALMRRDVWDKVRPLPDLLTADAVMHIRATLAGWPFSYLAKPLMAYRVHAGQLSSSEARFREDGVRLWEMFEFVDPACEVLRRQHLARALASRAATYVKQLKLEEANADLTRMASLDIQCLGARERTLKYLVNRRARSVIFVALWKCTVLLRRLIKSGAVPDHWTPNAVRTSELMQHG